MISNDRELVRACRRAGLDLVDGGAHLKVMKNGVVVTALSRGSGSKQSRYYRNVVLEIKRATGIRIDR